MRVPAAIQDAVTDAERPRYGVCNRCSRPLEVVTYPPDPETIAAAEDRGVEVYPRYRVECSLHRASNIYTNPKTPRGPQRPTEGDQHE